MKTKQLSTPDDGALYPRQTLHSAQTT